MKIFRKVHCKAYMEKYWDGVSLVCSETDYRGITKVVDKSCWDDNTGVRVIAKQTWYEHGEWLEEQIADLSNFEGDSVEKSYRRRVEEPFDGFLVGITRVKVTGRIGTDYDEDEYRAVWHLFKETGTVPVGVVYFKNNAKRYVLLDDIEDNDLIGRQAGE